MYVRARVLLSCFNHMIKICNINLVTYICRMYNAYSAIFQIGFNDYFNKKKLVKDIKAFGKPSPLSMTNIVGAIDEMHTTFNNDPRKSDLNVRLVGIVITDGAQNSPSGSAATALGNITDASNEAMADGITMISIGK